MPGLGLTNIDANALFEGDPQRLFLALTVIKSKPSTLHVKEYISRIRAFVQQDHALHSRQSGRVQVDSIPYPRNAQAESEDTREKLQERIHELERENEALRDKVKTGRNMSTGTDPQRKRKSVDLDSSVGSMDTRLQKKACTNLSVAAAQMEEARIQIMVDELELSLPDANTYLRQLYTLHQVTAQTRPLARDLATALTQLSSTILAIIFDTPFFYSSQGTKSRAAQAEQRHAENNASVFRMLGRTFTYLLKGLDRLGQDAEGVILQGQVIHDFLHVLHEILKVVRATSARESVARLKRRKNGHGPAKGGAAPTPNPVAAGLLVSHQLCRLFVTLMASLNTTISAHQKVMEGILFFLLDRVGRVLNVFVFGGETGSYHNKCLPETTTINGDTELEEEVILIEAEAPGLVWILEQAMTFIRQHRNPRVAAGSTAETQQLQARPEEECIMDRLSLADHVQKKLQNTLLKAVFNEDAISFEDRLREPPNPGIYLNGQRPVANEENVRDWFKQEVWRIVGWDVLRKITDWD